MLDRDQVVGAIALVGSGEFLPQMEEVDAALLDSRPRKAAFLPTAAAPEGADRVDYWLRLAAEHYARLGAEPIPVPVLDRAQADDPGLARLVEGAGLIYLSGGNPMYLIETLAGTAVWAAIERAWRAGAALAGCSAGAIALGPVARSWRGGGGPRPALGAVPDVAVIPHFDRVRSFAPQILERALDGLPDGVTLVGVDEDTAIVGTDGAWRVWGRQQAWVLKRGGESSTFPAGANIQLTPSH
jgi:cyanophycinase-like exopeptidase